MEKPFNWKQHFEIISLNTRIDKGIDKTRINLGVTRDQLWYIMLGLERLDLISHLQRGTNKLAKEIKKIGEEKLDWVK